jgi:hypothetical protein
MLCYTSLTLDSLKYLGSAPVPLLSKGHNLSPNTCTKAVLLVRLSLPKELLNNPPYLGVYYIDITDYITASTLDRVPIDYLIDLDKLESCLPVSLLWEVNVDIQDPPQCPSMVLKDLNMLLATMPLDGLKLDAEF